MIKKCLLCLILLFYSNVCFCSTKSMVGLILTGVGLYLASSGSTIKTFEIKTPKREWDFYTHYKTGEIYLPTLSETILIDVDIATDPSRSTIAYQWIDRSYSYSGSYATYYLWTYNHHIEYSIQTISKYENETQMIQGYCLASVGIYMLLNNWFDKPNTTLGFKFDNTPSKIGLLAYCKY